MSNETVTAALDPLDAETRKAYQTVADGLDVMERALPAEATDETRAKIGETIARARQVSRWVDETYRSIVAPLNAAIDLQRKLWRPLQARADALVSRAQGLVDALLTEQEEAKRRSEEEARRKVAEAQRQQAEAEAKAMAAATPAEQQAALAEADKRWDETRQAVAALDAVPASTSVVAGETTVYVAETLDFDVLDMGAFAKAHPELVEIRRGATLQALRVALAGQSFLPSSGEVPGWPGLKVKMRRSTRSRSK